MYADENKKRCQSCGYENERGAVFCQNCGAKLLNQKKRCGYCGSELGDDVKYCPDCGNKIDVTSENIYSEIKNKNLGVKNKKKRMPKILLTKTSHT